MIDFFLCSVQKYCNYFFYLDAGSEEYNLRVASLWWQQLCSFVQTDTNILGQKTVKQQTR